MKARIMAVVAAIALVGAVVPAVAQEEPAPHSNAVAELRRQFLEERAEILSQILEKRAELVRLSAATEPDVERVKQLVKEMAELRDTQANKCAEHRATLAALGQPDLIAPAGVRAGRLGVGPGAAHRAPWGQGGAGVRPFDRGYGAGRGYADRPGLADQRGARGRGPAAGFGRGQGFAPGQGRGGYGVRGYGAPGAGAARRPAVRPWGPGQGFIDRDRDGVCDYWEDLRIPGRPPLGPPPVEEDQPAAPSEV